MQYYPFDSRNPIYRSRLGALAEGNTLRLSLLLHKDARVHSAFFMLRKDESDSVSELRMTPADWIEDYRIYECEITPDEGLYWYRFRYTSDYGDFSVIKTDGSLGIVSKEQKGAWWQLTVYSSNFTTPDWLDGGIIYQIFPDRFCNSGTPKSDVPEDRFICTDWGKQPEYRQTDSKCSLGNDYYGGDLKGIEQKLDYLAELSVNCIYLNPIFEAHSNHRYNTADYFKLDPSLGTEEELTSLIKSAKQRGIYIILDGVFSHTGYDSRYFNGKNRYDDVGAANSPDSPYYGWYKFGNYPTGYACWWGVPSLPETDEDDLSFSNFIIGENGVIRHWLKKGIKGWRLDVADELPDSFLDKLRLAVKAEGEENYLLGEVWEDATNKISYGSRRRFLRGRQLDSVMNYPLSEAVIKYVKGGKAEELVETVEEILENYPPQAVKLLMNHIGTHDTARIITRLASDTSVCGDREWQSRQELTENEYAHGKSLLKLAALLQFTLPGVPSVYYGDEAGMTGWGDPFCRAAFPWGNEDTELTEYYKGLGRLRRGNTVFASGEFVTVYACGAAFAFIRKKEDKALLIALNRGSESVEIPLPEDFSAASSVFGNKPCGDKLYLGKEEFAVLKP